MAGRARQLWGELWQRPDPRLVYQSWSGERVLARLRLAVVATLLLILAQHLCAEEGTPENRAVAWGLGLGVAVTVTVFVLLRRGPQGEWLGFASSILDVSAVSVALLMTALLGHPNAAVNSRVIFAVYFLALFASGLRYDTRICLVSGACAVLQYGAIVLIAFALPAQDSADQIRHYGGIDELDQLDRVVLLVLATTLTTTVVWRSRRLLVSAARDSLTGVFNRAVFDQRLAQELERRARGAEAVTVAMVDVDHFKAYNDRFGHQNGDVALTLVAHSLLQSFRLTDVIARYGGDEFTVLVPGVSAPAAATRLHGARERLCAHGRRQVELPPEEAELTFSAGVATAPADGTDAETLLAVADRRMYAAKEGGGDRIVTSG